MTDRARSAPRRGRPRCADPASAARSRAGRRFPGDVPAQFARTAASAPGRSELIRSREEHVEQELRGPRDPQVAEVEVARHEVLTRAAGDVQPEVRARVVAAVADREGAAEPIDVRRVLDAGIGRAPRRGEVGEEAGSQREPVGQDILDAGREVGDRLPDDAALEQRAGVVGEVPRGEEDHVRGERQPPGGEGQPALRTQRLGRRGMKVVLVLDHHLRLASRRSSDAPHEDTARPPPDRR